MIKPSELHVEDAQRVQKQRVRIPIQTDPFPQPMLAHKRTRFEKICQCFNALWHCGRVVINHHEPGPLALITLHISGFGAPRA